MIQERIAQGVYVKDVAAELGVHPRTISRALRRGGAPSGRRPRARVSKLDPYKPIIEHRDGLLRQSLLRRRLRVLVVTLIAISGLAFSPSPFATLSPTTWNQLPPKSRVQQDQIKGPAFLLGSASFCGRFPVKVTKLFARHQFRVEKIAEEILHTALEIRLPASIQCNLKTY